MAFPGTKVPPSRVPKKGPNTREKLSPEAKQLSVERLDFMRGEAAKDVGPAPAHRRLYMRDYAKVRPSPGDTDLLSQLRVQDPLKP